MKRALSLMAATALGGVASADTTAPVEVVAVAPRTLATGAPACGNVMLKSLEDPLCPVVRNLRELAALGRKYDAALAKLDVEPPPLTVPGGPRPRP